MYHEQKLTVRNLSKRLKIGTVQAAAIITYNLKKIYTQRKNFEHKKKDDWFIKILLGLRVVPPLKELEHFQYFL